MIGGLTTITTITPASRPAGHLRIKSGRRTLAILHPREAEALELREGLPLSDDLLAALDLAAARSRARTAAERLIARRALSAAELRGRLEARGHDPAAVKTVVASLVAAGAIDDRAVAAAAAARALGQKRSTTRAARDLAARGIDPDLAAEAARAAADDDGRTDLDRALHLARSRLRGELAGKPPVVIRRRLAGVLARRGYDEDTVETVLDRLVPRPDGPE